MKTRAYLYPFAGMAMILSGCIAEPPAKEATLRFPDFPENVATIDLGQSITVDVEAENEGGAGVTWSCAGPGCGKLQASPASATFKASGIAGQAVLTATSRRDASVRKSLVITVALNESPDQLCK